MSATADSANGRRILPVQAPPFRGVIDRTAKLSKPDWPRRVEAPAGAPNVLVILTDDVGFGTSSTFGGPIPTPNLDRLARDGVRYNNFNTTAMCSSTRAALLTGRNHHAVASGSITDIASGYPGYNSVIPPTAATIAEILKDNGYNTAMFGKHHNIPRWETSLAGPFDHWPTGLGFEYFLGFIIGGTNQWHPRLYQNTLAVDNPPMDGTTLDHRLADDAIHWLHQQKAAAPDKPFFIYYAPGTAHAPHQAPADWIRRFKGQFDDGWDALRERTFARQTRMGIIPPNARLSPRPSELPAWSSLPDTRKRLYARYMEVFAGMVAYQDAQIGRLLDEMQRMGQLDNTLVLFIEGDNGASAEAGPNGTLNEVGLLHNQIDRTPEEDARHMDDMGGPHSYELFPVGWAWALNAPFPWVKQMASHLGGIRNGLVVRWPGHTAQSETIRSQFSYITDIVPTILDSAGIAAPAAVNGVAQQPITGRSLRYTFENAHATEPPRTQYFEMLGNRGIYKEGWFANTTPRRRPWEFRDAGGDVEKDYRWELYNLRTDFAQSRNLAASQPEKLAEMRAAFDLEAAREQVFPLDDRLSNDRRGAARRHYDRNRSHYEYWGADLSIVQDASPVFSARSFRIVAEIEVPAERTTGVIMARGSWFGGWSFYLKDGRPIALAAYSEWPQDQTRVAADSVLPAGRTTITYEFTSDGAPTKGGMMCIIVGDKRSGCARIEKTPIANAGQGETMDIGKDSGAPVTDEYPYISHFPGRIVKVTVDTREPAEGKGSAAH